MLFLFHEFNGISHSYINNSWVAYFHPYKGFLGIFYFVSLIYFLWDTDIYIERTIWFWFTSQMHEACQSRLGQQQSFSMTVWLRPSHGFKELTCFKDQGCYTVYIVGSWNWVELRFKPKYPKMRRQHLRQCLQNLGQMSSSYTHLQLLYYLILFKKHVTLH